MNGTFTFRLETLLRVRRLHRDERRNELAQAFRAEAVIMEQINQSERDLAAVRRTRVVRPGTVNVDRLVDSQRFEMTLRLDGIQLAAQRAQIAEEIERRREQLVAADRDVRVLEKLREKQQTQHGEALQRLANHEMDEIAARTGCLEDDES